MFATSSLCRRVLHTPSVRALVPSLAVCNAGPLPSNKGHPAPATSRPLTSVPTARRHYKQRRQHTRAATRGITYVDERAPTGSATMTDQLAGPNIITLVPRLLIPPLVSLAFFFHTSSRSFRVRDGRPVEFWVPIQVRLQGQTSWQLRWKGSR
jgi:hypothetical protein